jgi:hypothetical protein
MVQPMDKLCAFAFAENDGRRNKRSAVLYCFVPFAPPGVHSLSTVVALKMEVPEGSFDMDQEGIALAEVWQRGETSSSPSLSG